MGDEGIAFHSTELFLSMTADRTEQQSSEEQQRSRNLSHDRSGPPMSIPGYETRQFLGSGAYGEVWVAIDQNTGRRVAIKFYTHRGGLDWSLLSSEVEKLVFLAADRYVVQLLDVGWEADPPYYVMEFVENGSLEDRIQEDESITVAQAVEIFRDITTGLLHAHGKGVLHCDLKPANILLDQDNRPRLADFGQSRLSHEQTPALGTLFYMAPEQADLQAVPDARWDVYALGALLYCMLTGAPPYRENQDELEIDFDGDLGERLDRYRAFLQSQDPPSDHRFIPGVDSQLADIVDRCLTIDPQQRFANVQSVVDALAARDRARNRRPLLILGFLGPLLMLLVTTVFAWWGYQQAVTSSEKMSLISRSEGNGFAADFVSEAVARQIEGYFREVEELAKDPEFVAELQNFVSDPEVATLTEQLRGVRERTSQSQMLEQHPQRALLEKRIQDRLKESETMDIASWFVTDKNGIHLAAAFDATAVDQGGQTPSNPDSSNGESVDQEQTSAIGRDFSWRTYFHGQPEDNPETIDHIRRTHLSAVFQSQVTNVWKVAVSSPVYRKDEAGEELFLGIVALTVEFGRMGKQLDSNNNERFYVLVDGREGEKEGVILQHPLFSQILDDDRTLDTQFSTASEYRVRLNELNPDREYKDPLGNHPEGIKAGYDVPFIVASRNVRLDRNAMQDGGANGIDTDTPAPDGSARDGSAPDKADSLAEADTGLVVIVQENYENAMRPVGRLGSALLFRGFSALAVAILVVCTMWYFVARALGDANERLSLRNGPGGGNSTIHSLETLELPNRLKR